MTSKIILIIDDDDTLVEGLDVLFAEAGYTVRTLTSGEKIRSFLAHHTPHLIIIDYLMPGRTGAEITRELRHTPQTSQIPIIMIAATSAYSTDGYAAGINYFFTKPFDVDKLLDKVRYFLH